MGRKSSAKTAGQPPPPLKPEGAGSRGPIVWAAAAVAVLVVAGVVMLRPSAEPGAPASVADSPATPESAAQSADRQAGEPDPAVVAYAERLASLGPREQPNLPPIPFRGYNPPRSHEVITAAYEFAAEHPEILSYVPCFCGCERAGHKGSHDCFVKTRGENGDVTEWDEHGVECAVCIDVAHRSRQLYASGASVRDIRAAIEKEFTELYPGRMNVPHPPAAHSSH